MATVDFRSYVFIRFQMGQTAAEIHNDLTSSSLTQFPSRPTVFRWVQDMKKGTFQLKKGTSPGAPRTVRDGTNIPSLRTILNENPPFSTHQVAAEASLPRTTVY